MYSWHNGGNREAYYIAMQAAANPALHSVLAGTGPPGAILRLRKGFFTKTWTGTIPDQLESTMEVPASGQFEWHVNPAARPGVAGETWTLLCERPEGAAQQSEQVTIARAERRELDLRACGGSQEAAIDIRARGRRVKRAVKSVDATCRFEHGFRFAPKALPRALRRRGARLRLQAGASWSGNGAVLPGQRNVLARVRRR